jgi:5-methylcytosine-specific restriction endonuclease McrA
MPCKTVTCVSGCLDGGTALSRGSPYRLQPLIPVVHPTVAAEFSGSTRVAQALSAQRERQCDMSFAETRPKTAAIEYIRAIVADYVADSYECLAQIEIARRELVGSKNRTMSDIAVAAPSLTHEDKIALFAEFYWDAIDLPKDHICEGLGISFGRVIQDIPGHSTGVPCVSCGTALIAKSRSEYRKIKSESARKSRSYTRYLVCDGCDDAVRTREENQQNLRRQIWDDRQVELRKMPYADYLRSSEWQSTRVAALRRARYACQLCKAANVTLDVHHNTYQRRGHELPTDLIVLCRGCHGKHHDKLPESNINQGRQP